MKFKLMILLMFIIFSGCGKDPEIDNKGAIAKLSGTYSGVLPCKDCQGINYEITLAKDMKYTEKIMYLGKDKKAYVSEGLWKMENVNKVVLFKKTEDMSQFEYSKGDLIMLNTEGRRFGGLDSARYVLKSGPMQPVEIDQKNDSAIVKTDTNKATMNGFWRLIEINSQKIDSSKYHKGIPYLEIRLSENKFYGTTGCNNIKGNFTVSLSSIQFFDFIFTKMSCPGTGEKEYISALASVENFVFEKKNLTLFATGKAVLKYSR